MSSSRAAYPRPLTVAVGLVELPDERLRVALVGVASVAESGAVFDRQDAVAAEARLDGGEHALKIAEILDARRDEQLFARELGVSALDALAGDGRAARESRR